MRLKQNILIALLLLIAVSLWNCDSINPQDGDLVDYTCEGCHTNKSALTGAIDELNLDPPDEGHEAPG